MSLNNNKDLLLRIIQDPYIPLELRKMFQEYWLKDPTLQLPAYVATTFGPLDPLDGDEEELEELEESDPPIDWTSYQVRTASNSSGGSGDGDDNKKLGLPKWHNNEHEYWDSYTQTWVCHKHDWINNGTRTVWCKRCDKDGLLDPMTNEVTEVTRPKLTEAEKDRYK
jgi:hypothetical protein